MKKITLLLSFVACGLFTSAQTNLLVNPSFESWTGGNPDGWTIPANPTHAGSLTWAQESTTKKAGNSAMKLVISTTQNPGFAQLVPITPGKTYTLSVSYYVVSGDATDCRIWSSFKNGATYWGATDWAANTALQLKLQGSGSDVAAYFTIANGTWGTYTTEFVAPANATEFSFECRTYKSSTVIWDDFFFGEKPTGLSTPSAQKLEVLVSGKNLLVKNVADGALVEVFSALGSKVQSSVIENGKVSIENLKGGLYVVRSGKLTQKIML